MFKFLQRIQVLIGLALLPVFCHAETEVTGGQNAVVCFDNILYRDFNITDTDLQHITSIESYDLYEAKMGRGLNGRSQPILEIGANESVRDYVERIAKRYENYLPKITQTIHGGMFDDKQIIMRNSALDRVYDEHDVGEVPTLCEVVTMARQYYSGTLPFLQIDQRLFNHPKHSRLSQAILFLHEAVYYSARVIASHTNSRATRTLVGELIRSEPRNALELSALYQNLRMPNHRHGMSAFTLWYLEQKPLFEKGAKQAQDRVRTGTLNQTMVEHHNAVAQYLSAVSQRGYRILGTINNNSDGEVRYIRPNDANYGFNERDRSKKCAGAIRNDAEVQSNCVAYLTSLAEEYENLQKAISEAGLDFYRDYLETKMLPVLDEKFASYNPAVLAQVKKALRGSVEYSDSNNSEPLFADPKLDEIEFTIP